MSLRPGGWFVRDQVGHMGSVGEGIRTGEAHDGWW